ncbi:MAG: OS_HP3 family (seleno)protein, partial [Desulfobacteraceae bacterium]
TGTVTETISSRVKITPAEKYAFSITGTEIKRGKDIFADLQKISDTDNTWELVVENRKSTVGRYFDVITLTTDSKLKPGIKIRVFGNIVDRGKEPIRETP